MSSRTWGIQPPTSDFHSPTKIYTTTTAPSSPTKTTMPTLQLGEDGDLRRVVLPARAGLAALRRTAAASFPVLAD